uniref:small monomeric GTPase n=2 Tax=Cyprinus carpio TaxID=7962 RepID=A0A8C1FR32_CYPCA
MSLMFGKARTCNIVTVPEHEPSECNIVILGAMGSGKSALTVKFLTKRFISEYDPNLLHNLGSFTVCKQICLYLNQDGPVNCERYLGWANAFIIVYSIDNRSSFEACQQYLETVTLYSKGLQPEAPVILLGNKVDMERYRQVSKADGAALALRFGCLFFEVSACLDFLSVQHIFHEAVREVRRETERSIRPLFISEDKSAISLSSAPPLTTCYKELPTPATAKLVTVKSSRAQSKRRAPTLTLLKGFKIF